MTIQGHSEETLVTARMTELSDARSPWHRSLWRIGTILQLREILEYAESVRAQAIRPEGLVFVLSTVSADLPRDHGISSQAHLSRAMQILANGTDKKTGVVNPHQARALEQLVNRFDANYLPAWEAWVGSGGLTEQSVELTARSLVSHLLDAGFSNDHLHQWLTSLRSKGAGLTDVIRDAQRMKARKPVEYEVVVPLERCPDDIAEAAADRFMSPDDLDKLISDLGLKGIRQGAGALRFNVSAREPKAAVAQVELEVRRLIARVVVGLSSERVLPSPKAIVVNGKHPSWHSLRGKQRDILVSSIVRTKLLLPNERTPQVGALDDAFELLAAVETSTSWASVAAIWAAVEGLLCEPPHDSGVTAADRMAAIVTAGWMRAELTQLARVIHDEQDMRTALDMQLLDQTLDRIMSDDPPAFDNPTHAAAVVRVKSAAGDPAAVLERVRRYFTDSFRRLFQQRNNLLHGGRFDSVALPSTMRTVPPLVAAGVDRIVHAAMAGAQTTPLGLAARAENELGLIGRAGARRPHRLLD